MRDHRPLVRPTPELPIELVALDIDGTLVGEDMRLSDRTVAAIGEAVRRGVRVSLATGRRPTSAMDFASRLGLTAPVVGHQGAAVRAMPGAGKPLGRLLHHRPLAPEVILEVLAWCRANGLEPHVNDLEQIIVWAGDPTFEDYSAYLGVDTAVVPDLDAAITHPMSKVISVGVPPRPMELVEEARRVFAGRADATVSHPRFLEFVAPGVSKGRAVAWLAHRAGIPMGRVMAIGDALNDVEMIADAGHGAAMATAPVEVRRVARYVAAPVAEDGVAALIEALVLAPRAEAARSMRRLAEQARDTAG